MPSQEDELMIEGETVSLQLMEKDCVLSLHIWLRESRGTYAPKYLKQLTRTRLERVRAGLENEWWYYASIVDALVGFISHSIQGDYHRIWYLLCPREGTKDHAIEAIKVMVDYIFRNHETMRVEAEAFTDDTDSIEILKRTGFLPEGIKRKSVFTEGSWKDTILFSLIRTDWETPPNPD